MPYNHSPKSRPAEQTHHQQTPHGPVPEQGHGHHDDSAEQHRKNDEMGAHGRIPVQEHHGNAKNHHT